MGGKDFCLFLNVFCIVMNCAIITEIARYYHGNSFKKVQLIGYCCAYKLILITEVLLVST